MIEKKFKDVKGFEDKNTFFQEDQWETQRLRGGKNRYVFDLAFPIIPGQEIGTFFDVVAEHPFSQLEGGQPNYTTFENLSPRAGVPEYGNPGARLQFIQKNGSAINGITWTNFENTVNEDEATFAFDEDAIGFTNGTFVGTYGQTQKAEYVDFFRSGYVEFSFKTNKQNCIIASGSSELDANDFYAIFFIAGANVNQGASSTSLLIEDTLGTWSPVSVDYPYYQASSFDGALLNLNLGIKDGKVLVEYYDDYNRDDVNFNFIGNKTVADDEWHHVLINFGRPGLINQHGVKFNKKFVEIWVDGKLDKRFDDKVNEYKIFYPTVKWLFNNVKDCANEIKSQFDIETNDDYRPHQSNLDYVRRGLIDDVPVDSNFANELIGENDKFLNSTWIEMSINNANNKIRAFKGALHTFAHGLNIPLSQYEIKRRYRLWKKDTRKLHNTMECSALFVEPTISTNKKKALKLFWNNLLSEPENGTQLDSTYQVESYSVSHQIKNSSTELFNLDIINNKEVNILKNVKVAFTDNVLIFGPGKIWIPNTEEGYNATMGSGILSAAQQNPKANYTFDSVSASGSGKQLFVGPRSDLPMSGLDLQVNDRVLLTGQIKTEENGIWLYKGMGEYLVRDTDSFISDNSKTHVVYVENGNNKNTYWKLDSAIESFNDFQKWDILNTTNTEEMLINPFYKTRWKNYYGEDRLINLEEDLDINKYDIIVFMNYPKSNDEIFDNFPNDSKPFALKQYRDFIKSLENVCAQGASLFVSSPKLAEDLGIVRKFTEIDQKVEDFDAQSTVISPFEINEPKENYFDTHRINKYELATPVPGLTNKETYILTDFVNYTPENVNDYEQYHAKYVYRQLGLQEGDEFYIPSLTLRKTTDNDKLPGFNGNRKGVKPLLGIAAPDLNTGTVVTKLQNNYYSGTTLIPNPYDDYATSVIVHNGQLLNGQPITGKIFVNVIEDSYTMSRQEYNKAVKQVVTSSDLGETTATLQWQYSTTRLNRAPKKINVRALTEYGQTTPTNGGGGPLIQAPSNSSNGVIRSENDKNNVNYQSDLYATVDEERYQTQEIPVLSMTWLGLQWLAE